MSGKVLASCANSHGIDAIVMGAYHHSRLNKIVWGGVTKTVIGQPLCWVMISHQAPASGLIVNHRNRR